MKRTTVWLRPEQLAALAKRSEETGAPVAELIRRAVDAYITPNKKRGQK
jgi:hypothetical protein